jgi:hypothetical protein
MTFQSSSVDKNGLARTPDGKLYVTLGTTSAVPYELAGWGIPFILPSSGSIGNNGALSGLTALGRVYSSGCWMYFAVNTISAATPAGWYWTVMSSTTAGTIYNSTYTSGQPGVGATTAFATTGPGAFTGVITEITGPQITVPGGAMGANGRLELVTAYSYTNSANPKQPRIRFGGSAFGSFAPTATLSFTDSRIIRNAGSASVQVGFPQASNPQAGSTGDVIAGAINTAADATLAVTLQHATATENLSLEIGIVSVQYRA